MNPVPVRFPELADIDADTLRAISETFRPQPMASLCAGFVKCFRCGCPVYHGIGLLAELIRVNNCNIRVHCMLVCYNPAGDAAVNTIPTIDHVEPYGEEY
jgi:hypothetical protein